MRFTDAENRSHRIYSHKMCVFVLFFFPVRSFVLNCLPFDIFVDCGQHKLERTVSTGQATEQWANIVHANIHRDWCVSCVRLVCVWSGPASLRTASTHSVLYSYIVVVVSGSGIEIGDALASVIFISLHSTLRAHCSATAAVYIFINMSRSKANVNIKLIRHRQWIYTPCTRHAYDPIVWFVWMVLACGFHTCIRRHIMFSCRLRDNILAKRMGIANDASTCAIYLRRQYWNKRAFMPAMALATLAA